MMIPPQSASSHRWAFMFIGMQHLLFASTCQCIQQQQREDFNNSTTATTTTTTYRRNNKLRRKTTRNLANDNNIFYRQGGLISLTPEELFVQDCSESLVAKSVLGDQKISQSEYFTYLIEYCLQDRALSAAHTMTAMACSSVIMATSNNNNNDGSSIDFDELSPNLRDLFMETACPTGPGADASLCFFDFQHQTGEIEFGLVANPSNLNTIDQRVNSLCVETYSILLQEPVLEDGVFETLSPTSVPTASPVAITNSPTVAPVINQPTLMPSIARTDATTQSPTTITQTTSSSPTAVQSQGREMDFDSTTSPASFGNETSTIAPGELLDGQTNQNQEGGFTTAAILGIISALSSLAFCIAVIYSGGFKEPEYDMNKPFVNQTSSATGEGGSTPSSYRQRGGGGGQRRRSTNNVYVKKGETFRDEDHSERSGFGDHPEISSPSGGNGTAAGYKNKRKKRESTTGIHDNDDDDDDGEKDGPNAIEAHLRQHTLQKRLDPSLPPFHPDNIETEKQMRPKYAERVNPLNLLTPAANSWQPQG